MENLTKNNFTVLLVILFTMQMLTLNAQELKEWQGKISLHDSTFKSDSSYWKKGSVINLGFNRVGLYNWAGGGQNSMSVQGLMNNFLFFKHKKISWVNQLTLSYGIIRNGFSDSIPWIKNDDRIELTSKFGRKTSYKWDYSILFNFRTQFDEGYNTPNDFNTNNYFSKFFSPAFPLIALGFDYKKEQEISCFLSPATLKSTIVLDPFLYEQGVFGVETGKKIRLEAGGYLNLNYRKNNLLGLTDLNFKTNLTLFSNYIEQPENIDITWETLISYKFKKLFSITFSSYLVYDHDTKLLRYNRDGTPIYLINNQGQAYVDENGIQIQKRGAITQFKEVLALGLMFSL